MMDISNLYDLFLSSTGVSTDTRTLKKGNMYFALKGENFDGNKYAKEALKAGASAAVIDDERVQADGTIPVKNVLETLQDLARFHRNQLDIPVIGLTGSNGKTTSKELVVAALSQKFNVGYTQGNLNNHIGVPMTLLRVNKEHEIAVIEMGANHQGEIKLLCSICQPTHGFITNFGKAHLEGFGGVEGVIKGKSELYDFLKQSHGSAWVNIKDNKQVERSEGIQRYYYGDDNSADYPVYSEGLNESGYLKIKVKNHTITTHLTGAYNFGNAAIAVALAQFFGVKPDAIIKGISEYRPSNNRSQVEKTTRNILVKDFYNANPTSMALALQNFAQMSGDEKWVILGDMLELGSDEATEHQEIANLCAELSFENVILVGPAFARTKGAFTKIMDSEEAANQLRNMEVRDKKILIKGSRSIKLEKVADVL